MEDENYRKQISKGMGLLENGIRESAEKSNINIIEMNWYKRKPKGQNRNCLEYPHGLMITTDGKREAFKFKNEELADLPTDETRLRGFVRAIIRELRGIDNIEDKDE